jgi:serine protease inhibitor
MHRSLSLALTLTLCSLGPALAQDSADDLPALAEADAAFACDLYQVLREEQPGNLFVSPHSVSQALVQVYAGARGETAREMERVLHLELAGTRLHAARQALEAALASRGRSARGRDGQPFRLRVTNALWGQQGRPFVPAYLDLLSEHYGAGLHRVDFAGDTEGARREINAWVSERTEERIPELLQPRDISAATAFVLTNAVYFNAAWRLPFEDFNTRPGTFRRLDGAQVEVPFMRQAAAFRHARGEGFQVVELPHDGGDTSLVLIVPDAGRFEELEAELDGAWLSRALGGLERWTQLDLALPRFEVRSRFQLRDALEQLGMAQAFTVGAADFSGLDGTRDVFLSDVIHEAFVSVDEAGTEAAAATAVIGDVGGMPPEATPLRVDRPFLFVIRDRATGAVIFMGRVVDPAPSAS